MAESLKKKAEEYSIVILGHMNPRLHHPLWYQHIGAITEVEAEQAIESPSLLLMPPLARFETAGIVVTCQEESWAIVCKGEAERTRLLDIACRVFEKLAHTTVYRYGFNTKIHLQLQSVSDVSKCLGGCVVSLDLGLTDEGEGHSASFRFSNRLKDHSVNVEVQESNLAKDVLYLGHNVDYPVVADKAKKFTHYDLTPLLVKGYEPAHEAALENAKKLVAGIESRCGGVNAGNH